MSTTNNFELFMNPFLHFTFERPTITIVVGDRRIYRDIMIKLPFVIVEPPRECRSGPDLMINHFWASRPPEYFYY